MIEVDIDRSNDLTVMVCTGRLSFGEITKNVKAFYDSEPTLNIVWDLSRADTSGIESDDVQSLVKFTEALTHSRTGGKTALVSPEVLAFGLSRMYQTLAGLSEVHPEVQVFRSLEEAMRWVAG